MSTPLRSKVICALGVLLALTASRHNFPLRQPPQFRSTGHQGTIVHRSSTSKKYEGVTPSRRQVESRRAEWVRTLAATAGLPPALRWVMDHQDELLRTAGVRLDRSFDLPPGQTAPAYLLAFLASPPSRSLPPPA